MIATNTFICIFVLYNTLFLITYYFFWKKVNKLFRKCETLFYSWEIFEDGFEKRKKLIEENKALIQEIDELKLKFSTPLNEKTVPKDEVVSEDEAVSKKVEQDEHESLCDHFHHDTACFTLDNLQIPFYVQNVEKIKSNDPRIVIYKKSDLTKIRPIENFCDIPPLKPKKTFKKKPKKK